MKKEALPEGCTLFFFLEQISKIFSSLTEEIRNQNLVIYLFLWPKTLVKVFIGNWGARAWLRILNVSHWVKFNLAEWETGFSPKTEENAILEEIRIILCESLVSREHGGRFQKLGRLLDSLTYRGFSKLSVYIPLVNSMVLAMLSLLSSFHSF